MYATHHTDIRRRRKTRSSTKSNGTFDPNDARQVKHQKIGVWDFYVQQESRGTKQPLFPVAALVESYADIINDLPYLWRTVRDVGRSTWDVFALYIVMSFVQSLVPALTLW